MRFHTHFPSLACSALLVASSVSAITLDLNSDDSIKSVAKTVAYGMMKYYSGNQTGQIPGLLPGPYYWWEAGAMFNAMINYWFYTGDTTYNDVTTQAMLFQVGPDDNYMPPNQSKTLGNDDQAFWGLAAMTAAEVNFPNPPSNKPQWLALAQAVFNGQASRWDTTSCGGGLKWQIFTFNNGYNYKNAISNGCFFTLAARLAAYTDNQTYTEWAEKAWDWSSAIGLISPTYQFFDGSDDLLNCTELEHIQWSYNAGIFLLGAANMWKVTGSDLWKQRTQAIWTACDVFFTGPSKKIMYEVACEPGGNCNTDQLSFKAYLSRWMTAATKVAPFLYDQIQPYLEASAMAAAASCSGGTDGVTCGMKWYPATDDAAVVWDGSYGVGQQMSALEVIQSNLIQKVAGPVTNSTGGTSVGNPSAGTGTDTVLPSGHTSKITTGDKAGAGIITAIILVTLVGGAWWMIA